MDRLPTKRTVDQVSGEIDDPIKSKVHKNQYYDMSVLKCVVCGLIDPSDDHECNTLSSNR